MGRMVRTFLEYDHFILVSTILGKYHDGRTVTIPGHPCNKPPVFLAFLLRKKPVLGGWPKFRLSRQGVSENAQPVE